MNAVLSKDEVQKSTKPVAETQNGPTQQRLLTLDIELEFFQQSHGRGEGFNGIL
jgi:hypothetical protein